MQQFYYIEKYFRNISSLAVKHNTVGTVHHVVIGMLHPHHAIDMMKWNWNGPGAEHHEMLSCGDSCPVIFCGIPNYFGEFLAINLQ